MHDEFRFEGLQFPDDGRVLAVDRFAVGGTERIGVYGPNGAGKTTLLRRIAGTMPDTQRRDSVAYLPQRPHLFRGTVMANLLLGVADPSRAIALAQQLGLGDDLDGPGELLSGGERQRLALARTLASDQPVVLLDEPLAAIERAGRDPVVDVIRDETASRALVCVTHDLDAALAIAETLVVIDGGHIIQRGPVHDVAADPTNERVREIIGITNVVSGTVIDRDASFARARFGSFDLTVAVAAEPGTGIVVRFPAGAVAVHAAEPVGTSQRNHVRGRIETLTERGPMIELTLDSDPPLAAVVTPGALDALGVEEGTGVWFAIKTASIDVVAVR
jgi:molybdate transport system ATP-binding protein